MPKSSQYVGVSAIPEGWSAKISVNGRRIDLGRYYTQFDAAVAYDQAAVLVGRETNFAPGSVEGYRPTRVRAGDAEDDPRYVPITERIAVARAVVKQSKRAPRPDRGMLRCDYSTEALKHSRPPGTRVDRHAIASLAGVSLSTAQKWRKSPGFPPMDENYTHDWAEVQQWLIGLSGRVLA